MNLARVLLAVIAAVVAVSAATEVGAEWESIVPATSNHGVDVDGSKLLFLTDKFSQDAQETHSVFISKLVDLGYDITFCNVDSCGESIREHGEYRFDKIVNLASGSKTLGRRISFTDLETFAESGGDVFMAVGKSISGPARSFASSMGVRFKGSGKSAVRDASTADPRDPTLRSLVVDAASNDLPGVLFESKSPAPLVYKGLAHARDPKNVLLVPLLSTTPSSYTAGKESPSGRQTPSQGLCSAIQGRNGARVTICGSTSMFSDAAFADSVFEGERDLEGIDAANQEVGLAMLEWSLRHKGSLRMSKIWHRSMEPEAGVVKMYPREYVVGSEIEMGVEIEEKVDGEWVPFMDGEEQGLQIEHFMMDPFFRLNLTTDSTTPGVYSTVFNVPDKHGVYKLMLSHHRLGYSSLVWEEQAAVAPKRHDMFPRFMVAAFPYYASAISMVATIIVVTAFFLFHRPEATTVIKEE